MTKYYILSSFACIAAHYLWCTQSQLQVQFPLPQPLTRCIQFDQSESRFSNNCPITLLYTVNMKRIEGWLKIVLFPTFALFYFTDSNLAKVDATDLIRRQAQKVRYEGLSNEESCVELSLPSRSRRGQTRIRPAKILCFSGKFRESHFELSVLIGLVMHLLTLADIEC